MIGLAGNKVGDALSSPARERETEDKGAVAGVEPDRGRPPRLETATTCLTRFSSRPIRSRRAAFSSRSRRCSSEKSSSTLLPDCSIEIIGVDALCSFAPDATGMTGFTSSSSRSFGGGATDARAMPLPETTDCGTPRSEASVCTVTGDALLIGPGLELDCDTARPIVVGEADEDEPRRRAFSASSSATRTSSQTRCALRWFRERWADSRLRMV